MEKNRLAEIRPKNRLAKPRRADFFFSGFLVGSEMQNPSILYYQNFHIFHFFVRETTPNSHTYTYTRIRSHSAVFYSLWSRISGLGVSQLGPTGCQCDRSHLSFFLVVKTRNF